jgi:hypothetical protein
MREQHSVSHTAYCVVGKGAPEGDNGTLKERKYKKDKKKVKVKCRKLKL